MQTYVFDDHNVSWQTIEVIDAQIHVLAIDDEHGIVDVLIRFQPNMPGKLHQHLCEFSTLVLQGELQFQRPDGSLKEVRPAGSYVQVAANGRRWRSDGHSAVQLSRRHRRYDCVSGQGHGRVVPSRLLGFQGGAGSSDCHGSFRETRCARNLSQNFRNCEYV